MDLSTIWSLRIRRPANHTLKVRSDVRESLKSFEKRLKALGPSRETNEQQRKCLLDLATRFQAISTKAIEAQYSGDDAFDLNPTLKLATAVINRNESFSNDVWHKGHTVEFKRELEAGETPSEDEDTSEQEVKPYATRQHSSPDELDGFLFDEPIQPSAEGGIMEWLSNVYLGARGFEIGTFNASLVPIMWKQQSTKWDNLALGYISDIVSICHGYISDLLKEICVDDRIRINLLAAMTDKLMERYKRAIDQTHFILHVERDPLTLNHYFADNMEKWSVVPPSKFAFDHLMIA